MVWCTSLQHAKHWPPEQDKRPVFFFFFFNFPSTSQSYRTHQHLHQWVNPLYPDTRGTWPKTDAIDGENESEFKEKRMGDLMDPIWPLLEKDKELQELGILTSLSVLFLISHLWRNIMKNRKKANYSRTSLNVWVFLQLFPVGWFLLKITNFIFNLINEKPT